MKYPFYIKLFIVLTLFFIIPTMVIGTISSYQIIEYSEKAISQAAIEKLKMARTIRQQFTDTLSRDALQISMDSSISNIKGINNYTDIMSNPAKIMNLYTFQRILQRYIATNSLLHSIYLYPKDSDYILVSSGGIYKKSEFYEMGWLYDYDKNKVENELVWLSTRLVASRRRDANDDLERREYLMTCIYPIPPYAFGIEGVLVFNIYEREMRRLINSNNTLGECDFYIIDSQGKVVLHPDYNVLGKNMNEQAFIKDILNDNNEEGYIIDNSNNERTLITYYKPKSYDWIIIGTSSMDELMTSVNNIRFKMMYNISIFAILGLLISFFISRALSNPVNKLVQDIKLKKGIDVRGNEMEVLSKVFDSMIKQETRIFNLFSNDENSIREAYIQRFIGGKCRGQIDEELIGITFDKPYIICAAINIDKYEEFLLHVKEAQQEYTKKIILNLSEEILNQEYHCAGILFDKQRIILIINTEEPDDSVICGLKDSFKKIQSEIMKVFDFTISVGISKFRRKEEKMEGIIDQALGAVKYKLFYGAGSIIFYSSVPNNDGGYYYPVMMERHIINTLMAGVKDKMYVAVDDFIEDIRSKENIRYENIVQIFNQLIATTIKHLLSNQQKISDIFHGDYDMVQELSNKETIEEIRQWLKEVYGKIIESSNLNISGNQGYLDMAKQYIHENFRHDIDINVIADYVGISYSHLRKIFKDEMNENIINYINSLRICESKKLLESTNLTIKEISADLGYNNDQSFTRFFKKFEGITPNEYRSSSKKDTA